MSQLPITSLSLSDLYLITRQHIGDARGFLSRLFCSEELAAVGWRKPIAQVNHTYTSKRGTVRGMHFQNPPYCEAKLVHCLHGEIWDVVVDLRKNSPTFLKWHAEILSSKNRNAMLIPEGFAHGFQALTDDVELLYAHSSPYNATAEAGLNPTDPKLGITWPLEITECSLRDQKHPALTESFCGIEIA